MSHFSFIKDKGHPFLHPHVVRKYIGNYIASTYDSFSIETDDRIFRIHLIGYFYSQSYVDKWVQIAKSNSNTIFYAYLREDIEYTFDYSKRPYNLMLIGYGKTGYDNTVYETGLPCPRTHCRQCLKCFDMPMGVGDYPFL